MFDKGKAIWALIDQKNKNKTNKVMFAFAQDSIKTEVDGDFKFLKKYLYDTFGKDIYEKYKETLQIFVFVRWAHKHELRLICQVQNWSIF